LASAILVSRALAPAYPFPVLRHEFTERGETEVPGTIGPTVRRRELGAQLRALRTEKGWTVEQVAERLLISSSKVSRLETGQRGASARDIRDLGELYGLDEKQRQRLADLAQAGKRHGWWQPLSLPYSTYVGLEADATSIRDFGLAVMPGLLQTADYAASVLRAMVPSRTPDEVEHLVEGRMARQQRVLAAENPPQFQAILDASVLHRVVGGSAVMRAQLERLIEMSELPNVTIKVVPYEAGPLPVPNNKFIILSFDSLALPDVVFIEGLTGDLYLDRNEDTDIYNNAFHALDRLGASPEVTRGILTEILRSDASDPLLQDHENDLDPR
jgi:transcriptional regulator with XRE-family HTH domain